MKEGETIFRLETARAKPKPPTASPREDERLLDLDPAFGTNASTQFCASW